MGRRGTGPLDIAEYADTPSTIAARRHAHHVTPRRGRGHGPEGGASVERPRPVEPDEGAAARLLDLIASWRPAWHKEAACRGKGDIMFPENDDGHYDHTKIAQARELCATCPVTQECAAETARWPVTGLHGVWAGTTQTERRGARWRAAKAAQPDAPPAGWLTIAQAAQRVHRSEGTVTHWVQDGTLPAVKVGRLRYVPPAAVDRLDSTRPRRKHRQPEPVEPQQLDLAV